MVKPIAEYIVSFLVNDRLSAAVEQMTSTVIGLRGEGVSAVDVLTGGMREVASAAKSAEDAIAKTGKASSGVQAPSTEPSPLLSDAKIRKLLNDALNKRYAKLFDQIQLSEPSQAKAMDRLSRSRDREWERTAASASPENRQEFIALMRGFLESQTDTAKKILAKLAVTPEVREPQRPSVRDRIASGGSERFPKEFAARDRVNEALDKKYGDILNAIKAPKSVRVEAESRLKKTRDEAWEAASSGVSAGSKQESVEMMREYFANQVELSEKIVKELYEANKTAKSAPSGGKAASKPISQPEPQRTFDAPTDEAKKRINSALDKKYAQIFEQMKVPNNLRWRAEDRLEKTRDAQWATSVENPSGNPKDTMKSYFSSQAEYAKQVVNELMGVKQSVKSLPEESRKPEPSKADTITVNATGSVDFSKIRERLDAAVAKLQGKMLAASNLPPEVMARAKSDMAGYSRSRWQAMRAEGSLNFAYGEPDPKPKNIPGVPEREIIPKDQVWREFLRSQIEAGKSVIAEMQSLVADAKSKKENAERSRKEREAEEAEARSKKSERSYDYSLPKGQRFMDKAGWTWESRGDERRPVKKFKVESWPGMKDGLTEAPLKYPDAIPVKEKEPKARKDGKVAIEKPSQEEAKARSLIGKITDALTGRSSSASGTKQLFGVPNLSSSIGGITTIRNMIAGIADDSDRWQWSLARASASVAAIAGASWFQNKFEEQTQKTKNWVASFGFGVANFDEHAERLSSRLMEVGATFEQSRQISMRALQLTMNDQRLADRMSNTAVGIARMTGRSIEETFSAMEGMQYGDVNQMEGLLASTPILQQQFRNMRSDVAKLRFVEDLAAQGWVLVNKEADTFSRTITRLTSSVQKLWASLGRLFGPAFSSVVRGAASVLDLCSAAVDRLAKVGNGAGIAMARLASLLIPGPIGQFSRLMTTAAFATDMLSGAQRRASVTTSGFYAGLASTSLMLARIPVAGPAIAGITALVGTLWERLTPGNSIAEKWQRMANAFSSAFAPVRRWFANSWDVASTYMQRTYDRAMRLAEPVGRMFNQLYSSMQRIYENVMGPFWRAWDRFMAGAANNPLFRMFRGLSGKLKEIWDFFTDFEKQFILLDLGATVFFSHLADAADVGGAVIRNLGNNFEIFFNNMVMFGNWIRDGLPAAFNYAFEVITSKLGQVTDSFKSAWALMQSPVQSFRASRQIAGEAGPAIVEAEMAVQTGQNTREQAAANLRKLRENGATAITQEIIENFENAMFANIVRTANAQNIANRERERRERAARDQLPTWNWRPMNPIFGLNEEEQQRRQKREEERKNAPREAASALEGLRSRREERRVVEMFASFGPAVMPIFNSVSRFVQRIVPPGGFGAGRSMQEAQWSDPMQVWMEAQRRSFGPTREETMEQIQNNQLSEQERIRENTANTNATLNAFLNRIGQAFSLPGGQ